MAGELITRDAQVQWAGQLWGDGTLWSVSSMPGWNDLPGLDSGSVPRAQQHGDWLGRLLAQGRSISLSMTLTGWPEDFPAALLALEAATPIEQAEQPLVVQGAGRRLLVNGRITHRVTPFDTAFNLGTPSVTLMWECSDPRRYGLTALSVATGLPQSGSGLDWGDTSTPKGLDWHDGESPPGLDWGADGSSGDLTLTNAGTAPTHPVLEFRGPVVMPSVTLQETGQVLEYDLPLAASDVLTVDTAAGTVTLASGASRLYTVTARSSPEEAFVLPPGTSTLSFRAAPGSTDPAASMTVRYRPAYW